MLVICEECGLKYQIDPSKITGNKARFNCKGCTFEIVVDKYEHLQEDEIADLEEALLKNAPTRSEIADEMSADDSFVDAEIVSESSGTMDSSPEYPTSGKKKFGFGLATKVVFLMLLISLLPAAGYFSIFLNQINKQIINETNNSGVLVSNLLAGEVDEWIDKNVRALKAIAKIPAISTMNQFDQEVVLKSLQTEYPWMYLVFTTDERGQNIARSDGKSLADYSNRQYVKDVVTGSELAWQNLIGKTSKKPALVLAVPITENDIIVGVLAAAMTREAMSQLVANYRQGETGSTFIVDQNFKTVAHQNNAFVVKQQDMSNHPLILAARQGDTQKIDFIDANSKPTIGFAKTTKLGWVLALQQERDEAFAELDKTRVFFFSLLAVTLIVILILAFLASRAIVKPIKRLTDSANKISYGDLEVEIVNTSTDEIGDLALALMRMQDSIRLVISRQKRKRRRR